MSAFVSSEKSPFGKEGLEQQLHFIPVADHIELAPMATSEGSGASASAAEPRVSEELLRPPLLPTVAPESPASREEENMERGKDGKDGKGMKRKGKGEGKGKGKTSTGPSFKAKEKRRATNMLVRALNFLETSADPSSGELCSVCLDEIDWEKPEELLVTRCRHVFHDSCMKQSLNSFGHTCPNCRREVASYGKVTGRWELSMH